MKQVLAQETVLQRRLQLVLEQYGYTLIDCPPSLGILTTNALTVARYVLIPCACA
jgi:chromosome partitioning protein